MKSKSRSHFKVTDRQVNAEGVHLWRFDSELPVEVIHHSLSGHQPFRMNRHNYFEIVYVQTGEIVWQVQERLLTQGKGELFVIGDTFYHRVTERSSSLVNVTSLFFLPDLICSSSLPAKGAEYLMPFLIQDSDFPHVIPVKSRAPHEIAQLIGQINTELPATSKRAQLCVETYLKMILVVLLNHYATYPMTTKAYGRRQQHLERLGPFFEFLQEHYRERIKVGDASSLVGMSKSHFRRFFKEVTGQSLVTYVNHFRVARAQELLAWADKPIADVGLEVGFCDQSYFGLVFRKLLKMTPTEYRQTLPRRDQHSAPAKNDPSVPI